MTSPLTHKEMLRFARGTGALYLALAISGALGFLWLRSRLHVPGDAAATLQNLIEKRGLAQMALGMELAIVLTQALTAFAFYRLLVSVHQTSATALFVFGIVNSVVVLASAACLGTAIEVPENATLALGGDVARTVQILFELSSQFWRVGSLFFGLWLIPMGYVVASTGIMPRALGWTLMVGGIGYILGGFLPHHTPAVPMWLPDVLTIPATVGELWMVGYLLSFGVRSPALHDGKLQA